MTPVRACLLAIVALTLPAAGQAPPASFSYVVGDGTTSYTADFVLHSSRGPNFQIQVQQAGGGFVTHPAPPVRTYLGTIAALPGAMASAVRRADGSTLYHVLFEDGAEWINNGTSTTLRTDANWSPNFPSLVVGSGGAGSDIWAAELGVDLPSSQYAVDNNVDAAVEMIEHSVNTTNLIYLRDAGVVHHLGRIVVRADAASDPYAGMTSTNPLLTEIRNQWNNVLPPSTHDIGLVATSATGGGLAWVGVVGTSSGYSANGSSAQGDFTIVWRHEAGHNWSLGHFDGGTPEGRTINSGNALSRMSGPEQAKVIAHRAAKAASLDNLGPWSFPIPPRASLDRGNFEPQTAPFPIDVLDNDHDANGESFSISSFQVTTDQGGTVALSPGTGPGGRDELLYSPPAVISSQPDRFTYRIADTTGRESLGNVITQPTFSSDILAHFTLDDGAGTVALDSSSYSRHAGFENGPVWNSGTIGGGLHFDGIDDRLTAAPLNHPTNNFTITAWVKRTGPQNANAGIVFNRGGTTTTGLNFGNNNELRYHWDNGKWGWNSGLVVPDNTWTFVALTITPTAATIYMDPGTGMESAVNVGTHAVEAFDGPLSIGRDPNSTARSFHGVMDDVRIYCRTLGAAEIGRVAAGLASAANPAPSHLSSLGLPNLDLSWTSSTLATNHRIYFSSTYTDVRDGLPSADHGLNPASTWATPALTENTTYFWRVDTTDGTNWAEGPVWTFSVVPAQLLARWKFNETSGTTATDSSGNTLHATFGAGNPAWTPGIINGAIALDGNDALGTATVSHPTNELTIAGWIRRNGAQGGFSGIVFSRGGTTTAGLNFGTANELRYHWNDQHWSFNSGLVPPDGVWTFVALTIAPDRATFYMDSGSGLQTATNNASHAVEAFDAPLWIGQDPTGGRFFHGDVDDMRVYCRTLSSLEIAVLNTTCPDTFATWAATRGITGPGGDDDFDTLTNIIEYALDLDPNDPADAAGTAPFTAPDLSFRVNMPDTGPCDLNYVIEGTSDFVSWDTLATRTADGPWVPAPGTTINSQPLPGARTLWIFAGTPGPRYFCRFGAAQGP